MHFELTPALLATYKAGVHPVPKAPFRFSRAIFDSNPSPSFGVDVWVFGREIRFLLRFFFAPYIGSLLVWSLCWYALMFFFELSFLYKIDFGFQFLFLSIVFESFFIMIYLTRAEFQSS